MDAEIDIWIKAANNLKRLNLKKELEKIKREGL